MEMRPSQQVTKWNSEEPWAPNRRTALCHVIPLVAVAVPDRCCPFTVLHHDSGNLVIVDARRLRVDARKLPATGEVIIVDLSLEGTHTRSHRGEASSQRGEREG